MFKISQKSAYFLYIDIVFNAFIGRGLGSLRSWRCSIRKRMEHRSKPASLQRERRSAIPGWRWSSFRRWSWSGPLRSTNSRIENETSGYTDTKHARLSPLPMQRHEPFLLCYQHRRWAGRRGRLCNRCQHQRSIRRACCRKRRWSLSRQPKYRQHPEERKPCGCRLARRRRRSWELRRWIGTSVIK